MAKQAVDCRNMVRVKVWHTHTTVWLYSKLQSTYFNVLYVYFIIGPNVRSHYDNYYTSATVRETRRQYFKTDKLSALPELFVDAEAFIGAICDCDL